MNQEKNVGLLALFRAWAASQGIQARDSEVFAPNPAIEFRVPFPGEDVEVLVGMIGGCCVMQVPEIGALPHTDADGSIAQAIGAANYAQGLFHFGIDPNDGEIRLFVVSGAPVEPTSGFVQLMLEHLSSGMQAFATLLGLYEAAAGETPA